MNLPPTASNPEKAMDASATPKGQSTGKRRLWLALGLGGLGVVLGLMTWEKLDSMQTQLARQSADNSSVALEAKASAKQAQDLVQALNSRLSLTEAKLGEVTLQRTQLEELMQSLSRSRDENLVVDIESSLRLALQQAQLTGSSEPLAVALKNADKRISRAAQPRLAPLQRALQHDAARLKESTPLDTPRALNQLDELVQSVDALPLQNDVPNSSASSASASQAAASQVSANTPTPAHNPNLSFWESQVLPLWTPLYQEIKNLIRVSRIDRPDAALVSPDQAFFLHENLKLTLLNAKLSLLSHQLDSSRRDLGQAQVLLTHYFDPKSRRVQLEQNAIAQLQAQLKTSDLPRLDESFTALTTAAAGR